tara:strand:- start:537 stop:674 length:138 start_codon:yes stop_codon:yes gene_type:complete
MSSIQNEKILEWLVEEYQDLGYSFEDSVRLAREKFEQLPVPDTND